MAKRILYILLMIGWSLPMMAGIHSYADQSVLNSGHWVKIRVSESGICRMSFTQLRDAGIDPAKVQVFGYGGAMKTQDFSIKNIDDLPHVPVIKGEDYILFYAQGPISWSYNGERFVHTRNTYSNYGYYFLTDSEAGIAEEEAPVPSGTPTEVYDYRMYQVHELDSVNLVDRSGIAGGGREFYGEQFIVGRKRSFVLQTPNALEGEQITAVINAAAYSNNTSYFSSILNTTTSSLRIEGIRSDDFYSFGKTGTVTIKSPAAAEQQQVSMTLQNSAAGALGWLNYIELTTPCALRMTGSWMPVRTTVNYRSSTPVRFHLSGADANTQVWDITNLAQITRVPVTLSGNELQWTGTQADGIHEYVVINTRGNRFVSAQVMGEVKNQNLHALRNIDYIIICPEGYESISEDLARAHEKKEGITWAVVTDQQVYNEFSSGTPDATAYRWLMKMLYDRADGVNAKPRWLLLMGHGTYDNRKLSAYSGSNLLLCYEAVNSVNEVQAYATDDYFGYLEDHEGTSDTNATMDIGVGRLPVNNTDEARAVVDKIIRYMRNDLPGKWKNQIVYLADDGENGSHAITAEGSAELVRLKNPDFVVNKIYLDAYPQEVNASGESYPLAKNRLDNLLKNGVLFFDYSGHGGYNAITNESILNLREIEAMSNKRLGFWLFATCNFAQYDSGRRCAAEAAVLNPNGGAIAVLAATRTVYADQNTKINREVCDTLFGHKNVFHYDITLGEATAIGKNGILSSNINRLPYTLLGDPALRLNYPTDYYVQTTTEIDTLHALSVQQVEGRIIDEDQQQVSDFNGKVEITIYDKMQELYTRDNDNKTDEATEIYYNDYPNTLFSGSADVTEGRFSYTFMVPKDIRYNYGKGRIVYYAHSNDDVIAEAIGHHEDFQIGGTGSILSADTIGPQMQIYLNTPTFRDGDKTYATPRFFADLYDENGINTAGAGIGHDLMLIIDDDPKKTYSLNEYFLSDNGSYQAGRVSYLMDALPDGAHSLTFRAWDLLNNSTTQSLNFIVEAGLDPSISSVTTYPNPVEAQGLVNLVINYDQPDELLQTEIYLYNMSGQMVWSKKMSNPETVQINLPELGLRQGVYFYHVRLKSATSRYSTTSGKIIVTK